MEIPSQIPSLRFNRWLPYIIAGVGVVASIALWFCLIFESPSTFLESIKSLLPWIVLLLSVLLIILFAIILRLVYLMNQRSAAIHHINQDLKEELKEHVHIEETKQKLEKALLQGQKLQAIGTLAGGIAHDFNNILYAIIGYVEMARDDVKKEGTIHNNLGKVLEAAQRGQELISRILAFSRRQHLDFKPIQLQATIESVLSLLRPTVPSSVSIQFQPMPNDCTILGDQTQIHQVIVNIINNAVDAMDGEGLVTIKIYHVENHDDLLKQIPNKSDSNYCKIDISDTGHGMDQSTMERIFEPFYTTKEVGKGTGLGLSTVHAIMTEHKGDISVHSQLGHGTTFSLLLPEYKGE